MSWHRSKKSSDKTVSPLSRLCREFCLKVFDVLTNFITLVSRKKVSIGFETVWSMYELDKFLLAKCYLAFLILPNTRFPSKQGAVQVVVDETSCGQS